MRKGGGGAIISTSSVMGIVGSPTSPAYSTATGAISADSRIGSVDVSCR
jgi:NAD(P)-dependent dehydrogenase (short-subunit alcohol dehydrogenase family)